MIHCATFPSRWAQSVTRARVLRMEADALSQQAESALVTLALSGRPDAYGELVRRHQTPVYNIAYRLVGDKQDALDLTQDAFIAGKDQDDDITMLAVRRGN